MQSREKGYVGLLKKSREKEEEVMRYRRQIDGLQREKARVETQLMQTDQDSQAILDLEMNIRRELQKLDEEVNKVMRRKEKAIADMSWEEEKEMCEADKLEQEIAQKICWIVIDRTDALG